VGAIDKRLLSQPAGGGATAHAAGTQNYRQMRCASGAKALGYLQRP